MYCDKEIRNIENRWTTENLKLYDYKIFNYMYDRTRFISFKIGHIFFWIIKCKVQQSIRKSIFFKTKRKKNRKNWFFESWKVHTHQWTEYSVIRHTRSLACVTNETVRSNTRKRLSTPNGVRSYIQLKFFQIRIRASKNQQ